MKKLIRAGAVDQTLDIFIQDSSSTTGAGLTGLVYNTASLVCYYRIGATGTPTALTLATQTVGGAHSDGGFVAVDGTNMPGVYRLDLSDAIVATAGSVTLMLKGATNMAQLPIELQVVSFNPEDSVRMGLTALPNAAADAAGGLPISDAGGLDMDSIKTDTAAILVDTGTTLQAELDGIQADTEDLQTRIPAALVGGRMDCDVGAISTDATAANNLEAMLDGTGGVDLTLSALVFNPTGAGDCIQMGGSGSGNGIGFTRTGAGEVFDASVAAALQAEAADALVAYDPATGTEAAAIKSDTAAILLDTGTDGVVVAAGSKTGYSLTATTGLGNQTADITGNLSGSVGSVTGAVGSVTGAVGSVTGAVGSVGVGGIATTSFAAGAIDAAAIAADAIGSSELAQSAAQEIADEILNRDLVGGSSGNTRNVRNALRSLRNRAAIAAGTLTVYQEDDTTGAWTAAVTTTAGDPISQIDPA